MYKDGGETFLHTERVSHIHSYCSFSEQKDEASLRTKTCLKSTFFTQEDAEKFERTETTRNREPDRSFQRQKNIYFLESFLSHNKHFRAEITITTTRHGDSVPVLVRGWGSIYPEIRIVCRMLSMLDAQAFFPVESTRLES
jgi:hypothetical protein